MAPAEAACVDRSFWKTKRVFLTGHTGFKGSWLCLWLQSMGAEVTGYALEPPTEPSLFKLCGIDRSIRSIVGDVRNLEHLKRAIAEARPEIVIHMAAQALVRESYKEPVETYSTNVMGTVNLFEALRGGDGVRSVLNITTDKVYENKEWAWAYRENEPLGGYDPYSSSKACSELVTSSYRDSFFNPNDYANHGVAVASARAGNVVGGGDWAPDRLVPDFIRALLNKEPIVLRSPAAIRPWQHVLEPLSGYLIVAQRICEGGPGFGEAWNFGPNDDDAKTVEWIAKTLCEKWGEGTSYRVDTGLHPHEANYLKLDHSKAKSRFGWRPRWDLETALDAVVEWVRAYRAGGDLSAVCLDQIARYGTDR
jgi:CDP-glucose 4,6-dehydratase